MNNKIKNILNKLTQNGYKAYLVGGYVRDTYLKIETNDVDIATDATPKDVIEIFELSKKGDEYGSVNFRDSSFNYDITTFRLELEYEKRKPISLEFTNDLLLDAKRRDFTINAIYMDKDGNIIDPYDGISDLKLGIIRPIGNIEEKINQDPLRILRAIRFASELNFKLDSLLFNYIKTNKQLLRLLSNTRKKEELDLIFKSKYSDNGIKLIKDLNIEDELEIKIPEDIVITDNYLGMWVQIENDYQFSNKDLELLKNIKKIINYGIIDNVVLYEYGLYACYLAGEVLNFDKVYISDIYKNLPIYSQKDIDINGDEIISILNIEPSLKLKDIYFDLEINILNKTLENNKKRIIDYLLDNWR